jgi:hypothetical protein
VNGGQICVPIEVCRAKRVPRMDYVGNSDAYLIGRILRDDGQAVGGDHRWPVVRNEANPVWMKVREFTIPLQDGCTSAETMVQGHR